MFNLAKRRKLKNLQALRRFWRAILQEDNVGARRQLISRLSGVSYVSWETGWTNYLRVQMTDGWEHWCSSRFNDDPFVAMAKAIVRRKREKMC